MIKKLIKRFGRWLLSDEIKEQKEIIGDLKKQRKQTLALNNYLENVLGLGLDVTQHPGRYSKSWAAICIQGKSHDFVRFVNLRDSEIRHINNFLRQFDRANSPCIDAEPHTSALLKFERRSRGGN